MTLRETIETPAGLREWLEWPRVELPEQSWATCAGLVAEWLCGPSCDPGGGGFRFAQVGPVVQAWDEFGVRSSADVPTWLSDFLDGDDDITIAAALEHLEFVAVEVEP